MEASRTSSASSARHTFAGDQGLLFPVFGAWCARAEPHFYALLRAGTARRRERAALLRQQIDASAHEFHPGVDDQEPRA